MTALSVLLWLPVMAVHAVLWLAGLVIVPATFPRLPSLYVIAPGRPHTIWEAAIRNPVGGFRWLFAHPPADQVRTWGTENPEPTAQSRRFAWRFRLSGWMSSLRLVWRYSAGRYGELYVGWKLLSDPPPLDFGVSLRPWARVGA